MRNRRVRRYSSVIFSGLLLFLGWVCIGEVSDAQRQEEVSQLFEILSAIYDNDTSLIPDEPNEIIALQSSADSRDQLAWELFNMMRQAMDPNYVPAVDVSAEQEAADVMEPVNLEGAAEAMEVADCTPLTATAESSPENGMMTMASATQPIAISNPLGSCILAPGTYRIETLPLQVEGHVVMPAGVRLIAPCDPNNPVIEVLPGGLLETGKAAFYSEMDYPVVLPPVEIVPEDPNIYFHNNSIGVYVHRGANPKTRLENLEISSCGVGLVIDEQLTYPIHQVITVGCYEGIRLFAPAMISDCQFWYNGTVFEWMMDYIWTHLGEYLNGTLFGAICDYVGKGIYVCIDSESYPYPEVMIERTVVYDGDCGLYITAATPDPNMPDPNLFDPNQMMPRINVVNSCLASSYFYGFYQTQGAAAIDLSYCAFGGNDTDSNIDIPFTECIGLVYNPFYLVGEGKKLYVYPASPMADAGLGYAEDGMGTAHNRPDTGVMDIGSHFPLGIVGSFGFPSSPADFNWDGIVDELDLELMNACMGATNDPNFVRLDMDYSSRVDMPDWGLFAWDYGYAADPNDSSNNDPNCVRSDFDGDGAVDLGDMAVFADNWLRPVFDEYRVCSLCNLHTAGDPNDPNAGAGADIIDSRDYDVLMADWGTQSAFDPNIVIAYSASNVSVAVENPEPAWKISAFLDEEPIGQWTQGELGSTAFDADLTRYGPGSHKIKIVRSIGAGVEITERLVWDANSTGLYFADVPDTFEPNEPYVVSGFNLGDELNIKINNIWDQPVYDVNVPTGAVALEIPAAVFGNTPLCTLTLTVPAEMVECQYYTTESLSGGDEKRYKKLLKEHFDPNDWEGRSVRTVFLLPDKKVTSVFWEAICSAIKAVENQGLTYLVLTGYDVNQDNIDFLFRRMTGRRIVIYFGHANSHVGAEWIDGHNVGGVQRTQFQCYRQSKILNPGTYYNLGAVSYTKYSKPGSQTLPDYNETPIAIKRDDYVYDITRYVPQCKIDKMFIFGCLSALYPDMAAAQGCGSLHDHSCGDMMYCGFNIAVLQANGGWVEGIGDNLVRGLSIFFDKIGQDDSNGKPQTILKAIQAIQLEGSGIRTQCFGFNGSYDVEPEEADHQAIRFYGRDALNQKLQ